VVEVADQEPSRVGVSGRLSPVVVGSHHDRWGESDSFAPMEGASRSEKAAQSTKE